MTVFRCAACSAPLDPAWAEGAILRCGYCRAAQPSPFGTRTVLASIASGGWRVYEQRVREEGGELLVRTEPRPDTYFTALESQGVYDDFEATLVVRLLWGDLESSRVTLMFRKGEAGHYAAHLSTIGTFSLQVVEGKEPRPLARWAACDAIVREPGAVNRMRVRVEHDSISMFLNDRSIISLRDTTHRHGSIMVASYSDVPMAYAIRSADVAALERAASLDVRGTPRPGALPQFLHAPDGYGVEVTLLQTGANKIHVIKALREITGVGLAEAKTMSESAPVRVGYAPDAAEASRWIAHLALQGARAKAAR